MAAQLSRLLLLVLALLAGSAAGAQKKRSKSSFACGPRSHGELCRDKKACCARWGTCGRTEAYCGEACISGNCWPKSKWSSSSGGGGDGGSSSDRKPKPSPRPTKRRPKPPPPRRKPKPSPPPPARKPKPASPPPSPLPPKPSRSPPAIIVPVRVPSPPRPPSPAQQTIQTIKPQDFDSDVYYVSIKDEGMVRVSCGGEGSTITDIFTPLYGSLSAPCNSSSSYSIVAAACLDQLSCVLRASADVYGDPCPPGTEKRLAFSYRCSEPPVSTSPSPPSSSSSPNTSPSLSIASTSPAPSSGGSGGSGGSSAGSSTDPPIFPQEQAAARSSLWGRAGERWDPAGPLTDWSYAGYAGNDLPIPDYPAVFSVLDFGAKGDGVTDCAVAFQKAIDAAASSALAMASSTKAVATAVGAAVASEAALGAAVVVPPGKYLLSKDIKITSSNVVLRGAGMNLTTLYFPHSLVDVYGPSFSWNFGGAFISIVGRKVDSSRSGNYLASLAATVRRGDRHLKVSSTSALRVGQWVRLWARKPGNQKLARRSLLATDPSSSPTSSDNPTSGLPLLLFEDPQLQAAVAAAAAAETAAVEAALAAGPDASLADAMSSDSEAAAATEAALNPLHLDSMLLAAARYGSEALASEIAARTMDDQTLSALTAGSAAGSSSPAKVPAAAVKGSLDYYLYGDDPAVDSGKDFGVFPQIDHIRFVSRIASVGDGWVELERPLPYDLRLEWEPVLHRFAPSLQHSGLEDFSVEFKWSTYPDHFSAKGNNAIALYDVANCWVTNVKVVNADNGIMLGGADFVTIDSTRFEFTQPRGTERAKGLNGHHALWTGRSMDVRFTNFWLDGPWVHDLSVDAFAELTVFANGGGTNVNIDCHRAGTHSNLFSNIDMGLGTRAFLSGGDKGRGAHSGANNTWWNIHASRSQPIPLPSCSFGPQLTFVGNFGTSGGRRLLADVGAAAAAAGASVGEPVLALALGGGPIIIPEEEEEQQQGQQQQAEKQAKSAVAMSLGTATEGQGSSSNSSSSGGASSGELVQAVSAGDDCRSMGWYVERVPASGGNAQQLLPADLASAQLAFRKIRQLGPQ